MAHETAGDPVTGLKWTRRTTAKVAAELHRLGIDVCPRTVARLLKAMGFSLRVNHKKLAGASHPDRNDQFERITALRKRCAAENIPVISVDTKKKELVGAFRNPGAKWDHTPELVKDHDFRSEAEGIAIPYGIYDPRANTGTVFTRRERRQPRVRRRLHREVVAHRGPQALSPRRGAADPSPTAAAATAARRGPGSSTCNIDSATVTACESPWPTTRRPHRSGIPSNTVCSAKSARTGPAALWTATRPS